jgi:hypothetical protein
MFAHNLIKDSRSDNELMGGSSSLCNSQGMENDQVMVESSQ